MDRRIELALLIVGLLLFMFDVGTDCYVAHQYKLQGRKGWFDMTITFIIIPLFIVNVMAWHQTYTYGTSNLIIMERCFPDTEDAFCCCPVRFFLQFSVFSMFDRYIQELVLWKRKYLDYPPCCKNYELCNCEKCRNFSEVVSESNGSAYRLAWIRYIETLFESIPQWCLQVYVMLSQWSFPWYSVLSTVIALLSLAWSNTALEKARANKYGHDFNVKSTILYFTSQLAVLVARLFSIVTCAYAIKTSIFFMLLFLWLTVSLILTFTFCGYMIFSCCRDRKCCDGSAKKTCKRFLLTLPLTFYVSETALESLGFTALWIKLFLFVAKSLENLLMLGLANNHSLPHMDILMPIAWALFGVGTVSGFISLILRHSPKRIDVPANPGANGNEPQVTNGNEPQVNRRYVHGSGTTSVTNRAFVV